MSPSFPSPFPISDNRSYPGGNQVQFEPDAVEYSHGFQPYHPNAYDYSSATVPLEQGPSSSGVYFPSSTTIQPHPDRDGDLYTPEHAVYLQHASDTQSGASASIQLDVSELTLSSPRDLHLPELPSASSSSSPLTHATNTTSKTPAAGEQRPTSGKGRRERSRLQLAPDQPLTTQGRPRTRVYVACMQCRGRKIRCDGAKPVCHNCSRRTDASDQCTYDAAPKRRGPDKMPGARQRSGTSIDGDEGTPRRRVRRRTVESGTDDTAVGKSTPKLGADGSHQGLMKFRSVTPPLTLRSVSPSLAPDSPAIHAESGPDVQDAFPDPRLRHGLIPIPHSAPALGPSPSSVPEYQDFSQNSFGYPLDSDSYAALLSDSVWPLQAAGSSTGQTSDKHEDKSLANPGMPPEPSVMFARETWWDALLDFYNTPYEHAYSRPVPLTPGVRETLNQRIINDFCFLFQCSTYWLAFIHAPRLIGLLRTPAGRSTLQPSFVWGALALSTFLQSSDLKGRKGERGREHALRMRDEAQSALVASVTSRRMDENLVEASWVLAFFEACAHPLHSTARVKESMVLLDSLVRSFRLTTLDADDPRVSVFPPRSAPVISCPQPVAPHNSVHTALLPQHSSHTFTQLQSPGRCWCSTYTIERLSPDSMRMSPLWSHTPAWSGDDGEVRKEQSRRLVWSTVLLAAGWTAYNAATNIAQADLFIMDAANFALLFPGEALAPTSCPAPKESIWALYMRALLLWHSCVRMHNDLSMSNADKAQYAMDTWKEADVIENALGLHTCNIERTFLFFSRDYLFLSRLCIYGKLQQYAQQANITNVVVRAKIEEWLKHHDNMARRTMNGLHTVTGQPGTHLSMRPAFVWWFIAQISRTITLWSNDRSLIIALQTCKSLLAPLEYLMTVWPCGEVSRRFQEIQKRLLVVDVDLGLSTVVSAGRYLLAIE